MQVSIDPVRPAWIKSSSDGSATAYREHINQRPTLTYREHTRPTGGPMNHLLAHPRVQGAHTSWLGVTPMSSLKIFSPLH